VPDLPSAHSTRQPLLLELSPNHRPALSCLPNLSPAYPGQVPPLRHTKRYGHKKVKSICDARGIADGWRMHVCFNGVADFVTNQWCPGLCRLHPNRMWDPTVSAAARCRLGVRSAAHPEQDARSAGLPMRDVTWGGLPCVCDTDHPRRDRRMPPRWEDMIPHRDGSHGHSRVVQGVVANRPNRTVAPSASLPRERRLHRDHSSLPRRQVASHPR